MKKKFLFAFLLIFSTCSFHLMAQIVFDVNNGAGKNQTFIEQSIDRLEKVQTSNQTAGSILPMQSQVQNPQRVKKDSLIKDGKSFHNLTIRFQGYSDAYEIGEVVIVNEQLFYDRDLYFSADIANYGIENGMVYINFDTVVEGNYHVMLNNSGNIYCQTSNADTIPMFVFMEININRDIDTIINMQELATHKVYMTIKDENGTPINNTGDDNIFQYSTIDLQFPTGSAMKGFAQKIYPKYSTLLSTNFWGGSGNYFLVSDINSEIRFMCTQAYLKPSKLYMSSFDEQSGCMGDVTLTNIPDDFQTMEWIFNPRTEPNSPSKYLTIHFSTTCYRPDLYYSYFNSTKFGMTFYNTRYPVIDGESLTCYLDNRQWENDKTSAEVIYWEGTPSNNGSNPNYIQSAPFFIFNDSIVVGNEDIALNFSYKIKADNLFNPVQFNIGQESTILAGGTMNNIYDPNGIYYNFSCTNQSSSAMTSYELSRTLYSLGFEGQELISGVVSDFPFIYSYNNPGVYSLTLTNNDYVVNGIQGELINILTFDVSGTDADAPRIQDLRIVDEDGLIDFSNTFNENSTTSLIVNLYDYVNFEKVPILADNIKVYYKTYSSDSWLELPIVSRPDLSDTLFDNNPQPPYCSPFYCYSSDLTPALVNAACSFIDLKIEIVDETGNTNTQQWHPAFYVDGNIGLTENESDQFLVYPNPANGELHIIIPTGIEFVKMYNQVGQLVRSSQSSHEQQIHWDTRSLQGGTYFLKFIDVKGEIINMKVIIL